jgi:hypothetical protein
MVVMVVTTEGRRVACLYRKDPNESALLACICVKVGVLLEPIDFLRCVCGIGISLFVKHFYEIKFTFFNFILFLPIAILILFFKITKIKFISSVEKKPNFLINKLAFFLFAFECFFINKMKFPFGISLLFFGKKIND